MLGIEFFVVAVGILILFAVFDLVVGVSNDAANFLNSSLGSKVAPRYVVMIIASLGILAGVMFSSGMMEVARKGIFNPGFFTMPELVMMFLAVMIADILLLDTFNSFGLPTSTTVSIVFELLGAAVALSLIKIISSGDSLATLANYINTNKAIMIIVGILLSVIISFIFGAIIQFYTRLFFTFEYKKRLSRYGFIWGGVALSSISYFILIKGAKGAVFMTPDMVDWIHGHTGLILIVIFGISALFLQVLSLFRINILKPIILIGTFALAMAFAANDLVNFIGVPLAGLQALKVALASTDPMGISMSALSKKVHTESIFVLLAGLVMIITLWVSKKARTVSGTELSLGSQEETSDEKFESSFLSRNIVRLFLSMHSTTSKIMPIRMRNWTAKRFERNANVLNEKGAASFDLLRASVNLMVASAVISYATSFKLPLSTTYVTFMVSMGTSFADRAWGRESAVYRITGVLAVIGGWFMTALSAFVTAFLFLALIYFTNGIGVILLMIGVGFMLWKNHVKHKGTASAKQAENVFYLKNIDSPEYAIVTTFEHMSIFLDEIRTSINNVFYGVFNESEVLLREEYDRIKKVERWSNIVIANVYKAMRLLQQGNTNQFYKYAQVSRRLQKLANGHREIAWRAYRHVSNQHRGLLEPQKQELEKLRSMLDGMLVKVRDSLNNRRLVDIEVIVSEYREFRTHADTLNKSQMARIVSNESKTRLSILYYSMVGTMMMLAKQNMKLVDIFQETFGSDKWD